MRIIVTNFFIFKTDTSKKQKWKKNKNNNSSHSLQQAPWFCSCFHTAERLHASTHDSAGSAGSAWDPSQSRSQIMRCCAIIIEHATRPTYSHEYTNCPTSLARICTCKLSHVRHNCHHSITFVRNYDFSHKSMKMHIHLILRFILRMCHITNLLPILDMILRVDCNREKPHPPSHLKSRKSKTLTSVPTTWLLMPHTNTLELCIVMLHELLHASAWYEIPSTSAQILRITKSCRTPVPATIHGRSSTESSVVVEACQWRCNFTVGPQTY